jgi:hypothetical protein
MPEILNINTWKKTYLVSLSGLYSILLSECNPSTRVPHGQLRKIGIKKENIRGPRGEAAAQATVESLRDGGNEGLGSVSLLNL